MSEHKPGEGATPEDLPERVSEDLGGVQGEAPDERANDEPASPSRPGEPASEPAPDAGEIEWAGQLVKKPPAPQT